MRQAPEALARRARLPRNRVPDRGVRELRCPGRRAAPPARPAPQARPEWTTPERPALRDRALLPLRLRRTPGRTAQPAIPRLQVASPAATRPAPTRVDRGALAGASARRSRPALADRVQSLPSRQHRDELRNPCRTGLGLLGGLHPVQDRVAVGSVELIEER